jgi:gamma-glutamylcyclotransferase
MANVLIFAFGSNMNLAQMKKRCPNSDLASFMAEARGWKLCFPRYSGNREGGVGSIERQEGSSVWGVVFSVNEYDLPRLDNHEGVPKGRYSRGTLKVHKQNGEAVETEAYFAVRQREQDFTPHRKYIDLYVQGAKHFGLPAHYIGFLESLQKNAKID